MTQINQTNRNQSKKSKFIKRCPECDGKVLFNIQKALCLSCGWKKNLLE